MTKIPKRPVQRPVVLLCLAVVLLGAGGAAPAPADGDKLTLLSFNVRLAGVDDGPDNWDRRRELVFDIIRDVDPDIAGLQEPELIQLQQFEKNFKQYRFVGRSAEDGAPTDASAAEGKFNPIMYRRERFQLEDHGTFWFSHAPRQPGSIGWDAALPRICTWVSLYDRYSGRTLYVYNVHLDYASQTAREKSTAMLLETMIDRPTDGPVFVTGDFNANIYNPALQLLLSDAGDRQRDPRPLVDTFHVVYPEKDPGDVGTFHRFTGEPKTSKIDFVLAPADLPVEAAGIIRRSRDGRYPSDHFPVWSTVRFDSDGQTGERRSRSPAK